MNAELENILAYIKAGKRVCPQPQLWNELWEMLPNKNRVGSVWEPPLPLILGAWWHTSDAEKRSRLFAHIQWAAEHDALPKIADFIISLSSEQWHYEE
jgi:hypothetical protein